MKEFYRDNGCWKKVSDDKDISLEFRKCLWAFCGKYYSEKWCKMDTNSDLEKLLTVFNYRLTVNPLSNNGLLEIRRLDEKIEEIRAETNGSHEIWEHLDKLYDEYVAWANLFGRAWNQH